MKTVVLLSLLCLSTAALAQFPTGGPPAGERPAPALPGTANDESPRGNGRITGVLIDSTTSKPVEFATIALLSTETGKPVDGTTADERGRFTISRIAPGAYRLQISFLGYKARETGLLRIERGTEINLGNIFLLPDVRTLQEVNVVGQAAVIEEKVDRLVYNAEKDVTTRGGDATDVMRRVPLLSVDLDGNVSLRGSQNVRVLINNKPSTIVAQSVADALKQIPADMIKSVEVITSPSARYDAEGSAGIINIITKKNTLQGLSLNVDAGVGNRGSNLGLNGNYRTGKMGFSLGGFGRANYNVIGEFENTQRGKVGLNPFTTQQSGRTLNRGVFGNYQLGWDYDLNKNNTITASVRYGARNNLQTQSLSIIRTPLLGQTLTSFRDVDIKDLSGTVDVNVDYTRTLRKPQQEFSLLTQYSRNNRTNRFDADIFDANRSPFSQESNDNQSFNQEITFQADYQTPIKKNQQIEFGGKGIFRQVQSDFRYFSSLGTPRPSNILDYEQNVAASYLSYTYTTKNRITLKAGARYEYTMINASFQRENRDVSDLIPDYSNFVPTINLSKSFKGGKTVRLGYNRRLQRPGIQFLNPNVNAANPQNITVGNPFLQPELTDNFEASVSANIKAVYLNLTAFGRISNNAINSVRTTDPQGVITTTYDNIGQEESYGLNLFGNVTLFSKWQIGGGTELYYAYLTNNVSDFLLRARNEGFVINGRLFSSLSLKNGWGIQGFGFVRGSRVELQGRQGGFGVYNLGVRKDFKNKRGSLGLSAENFLSNTFRIRNEFNSPTFTQTSQTLLYNRGVRLNFNYRIGKMSFDQQRQGRRRRSVDNDDVKQGESDGGTQQQPAGGAQPGRQRN